MNALVDPNTFAGAKPVLVTVTGPIAGDAKQYDLPQEMTIAEAIEHHRIVFRLPTIAMISFGAGDPEPVLRGQWNVRRVRAGEVLTLVGVPRGGGGGGKRIIGLIASLALSIVAPFVGTAVAGALNLAAGSAAFSAVAGLASAAFAVGGSMLLATLLRPTQSPQGSGSEAEQVYLAQASSNQAMPLQPIPCPYGIVRYPPPFASRPYFEFQGNDQYLYQLFCWGVGSSIIERWEIGDTLAWTSSGGFTDAFDDIEIEVVQPGGQVKLFPANVTVSDNVSGQELPDPPDYLGPFAVNPPGTQIEAIALDIVFPAGLFKSKRDGTNADASRELLAEYRAIDDLGNPIGPWQTLGWRVYTNRTRTPQRITEYADVPAGRYEVALSALDYDTTDDEGEEPSINRVTWVGLRGYLKNFVTPQGVTLIATKIRANEQLSGAASNQYFFTGRRRLPTFDPVNQNWDSILPTRNPAWAVADALRNTDYGLGMPDSQIDVDWLAQYAQLWESRHDYFDAVFDRQWTAMDALNAILEVGRAQIVRLGGRIGFVRDEPKQIRRHVFTPRNIVRDTIERTDVWFDEGTPDHVKARFINQESWQEETIDCFISTVGAEDPQEMEMFGIIDRDHAWREGVYRAADNAFRRSFRRFTVEAEGRLLVRGDPILLHDPLGTNKGIVLAAIVDRNLSSLDPRFTVDRDFDVPEGDNLYVTLRDRYGREWGPCLVASVDGRVIHLDPVNRLVVEVQHGELADVLPTERSESAHLMLMADSTRMWDGLIVSAEPNGRLYDVVCVNDDQRVHLADETEVPPAPYTPPDIFSPRPDAPPLHGLYANAYRTTFHIELEAGWQPSPGAARYVAEISYDDNAATSPEVAAWTPIHDSAATRLVVPINPQPLTLRVAAIGLHQGPWSYAVISSIPELYLPPEIVDEQALDLAMKARLQKFDEQIANALARVRQEMDSLASSFLNTSTGILEQMGQIRIGAGAQYEENSALVQMSFLAIADVDSALSAAVLELQSQIGNIDISAELEEVYLAIASVDEALSLYILSAEAQFNNLTANGLFQITTGTAPDGASARIQMEARASTEDAFAAAGLVIDAGITSLGGKSQVQIYAQQEEGDPRPVFTVANGQSRIDGSLLLPRSVMGAKVDIGEAFGDTISYSGGNYDSGWETAVTHLVDVDALTEFVDFAIMIGPYSYDYTISGGQFVAALRLVRNSTQIWPPSAFTGGVAFQSTAAGLTIAGGIYPYPYFVLDFPPSPGAYTYEWQHRITITGGTGGGSWSYEPWRGRVIYPKNQV